MYILKLERVRVRGGGVGVGWRAGQRGAPPMIGAGNVLVFTLEMLEINCKTISQPVRP